MKCLALLILICSHLYGQGNKENADAVMKGDSLEKLYSNMSQLHEITDTLHVYGNIQKELKFVRYFFDSSDELKKISFNNSSEGLYHFYFDNKMLRKIRIVKGGVPDIQYYFTDGDNSQSFAERFDWSAYDEESKNRYQLLGMAQRLVYKFKLLIVQ